MTCSDIAKVIVSGKETTNSFTVPEGSTIETVAETLAKDGLVDKKKFLEAAQNSDAYSDFGFLKDARRGRIIWKDIFSQVPIRLHQKRMKSRLLQLC